MSAEAMAVTVVNWSRGIQQTHAGDLKMVTEWATCLSSSATHSSR